MHRGLWQYMNRNQNGNRNPNSKLNDNLVKEIVELYSNGHPVKELAVRYKVGQTCIRDIISGKKWQHIARPNLSPGSREQQLFALPPLSNEQQEIIIGSLLGDASITQENKNARFVKPQAARRYEYLKWMHDTLSPYSCSIIEIQSPALKCVKGEIIRSWKFGTLKSYCSYSHCHPVFTKLREEWYPDSIKIVPQNVVLTPRIIAIWFCDDGSMSTKNRKIKLSTNAFSVDENNFLVNQLRTFGIESQIYFVKNKGGLQPTIHIFEPKSFTNFITIVKPYITLDCFQYKVDLSNYKEPNYHPAGKLTVDQIIEIKSLLETGMSQRRIGKLFGVGQSCISDIKRAETWKEYQ
jgi:hypothetical protein